MQSRRGLEYAHGHALTVVIDAEDAELAGDGCVHEGAVGVQLGLTGIPVAAEVTALSRALALATACETRVHVHGVSSAAGVALLRAAKAAGLPVTADTPVWNLHFTDEDIGAYAPAFHLRPPVNGSTEMEVTGEIGHQSATEAPAQCFSRIMII